LESPIFFDPFCVVLNELAAGVLLQDIKPPNKKIKKKMKIRLFTICASATLYENEKKISQKSHKKFTVIVIPEACTGNLNELVKSRQNAIFNCHDKEHEVHEVELILSLHGKF
jgi:hypothetical protein